MSDATTRIETLHLLSYRRFEDLTMDFDPALNVLVATNGGGKTAILDALVSSWTLFFRTLGAEAGAANFSSDDVRLWVGPERAMKPMLPAKILVKSRVAGEAVIFGQTLRSTARGTSVHHQEAAAIKLLGRKLLHQVMDYATGAQQVAPTLPLVCYYGTGRLWSVRPRSKGKKGAAADTSRCSGYTDCLTPTSSFQVFESWFRRFAYEAQSETTSHRASPHQPRERLDAVRVAVGRLLTPSGWQHLEWDFAADTLVASHAEHGRLPVRLLSDGIRNMIGLVGDIAHRAVRLNPHFGAQAPEKTPGIVMIDEVDMHLHPEWQHTVLGSLQTAFPAVQLIVTTQSPLVVSTAPSRCVRILRPTGTVSTPNVELGGCEGLRRIEQMRSRVAASRGDRHGTPDARRSLP